MTDHVTSFTETSALAADDTAAKGDTTNPVVVYALGLTVFLLYGALFQWQDEVLSISVAGRWNFIYPVAIAFTFSFAHGAFTGMLWNALGLKAKK
ncbi:MAG: hypothetical protein ACM33T_13945 [Solirubrobacterales bacterium]